MHTKISYISSAFIGIVFGILSNYSILLGSWINLVVWSIVGILIGFFIENKSYIRSSGLIYGFFLVASFLIFGFKGTSDKIFSFILLSILLSFVGSICGLALVFIGNWVKKKFR